MAVREQTKNGFDPAGDGAEWDDPCQGIALSCNLIAALSSCGWVCYSQVKQVSYNSGSKTYTMGEPGSPRGFYGPNGEKSAVSVSNLIMMDDPTGLPRHGHVHPHDGDTGIFPALYEKLWLKDKTGTDYPNVAQAPVANWPNNQDALLALTGWPTSGRIYTKAAGWNPWLVIAPLCEQGKIKVPMVAWTATTGAAQGWNQLKDNHYYSVLGVIPADQAGANYIVLRNPLAVALAGPNPNVISDSNYRLPWAGSNWEYDMSGNHVQALDNNMSPVTLNLGAGVFGLHKGTFASYFAGFGWVGWAGP